MALRHGLVQGGPPTFDLRAIFEKRDNSLVASNNMVYKTTEFRNLKLKTVKLVSSLNWLEPLHNSKRKFITSLYQLDACGRGFSDTIVPLSITVLVEASRQRLLSSVSPAIRFRGGSSQ